jgi:CheY-like chemotaxis protein
LCVAAEELDDGHTDIQFSVVDTGAGISASKQKKIFDSFAQEDGSTTRRYGGTGLGLAISKQLVEMMGGDLRVESESGHGSVFSFSLRMAASSESEFSESIRSLQRGIFKRTIEPVVRRSLQGHVLLGEDNAVNQQVAIGMLEAMGVKVTVASNGKEVAGQFASGSFDAILMDCQMPVMDGFQSTDAIRHLEAERTDKPVPIIAVTANALAGDREKCIAAGMNDYLSKPYTMERLYKVLSKYLVGGTTSPQVASDDPTDEISAAEPCNSTIAIDPAALHELSQIQQAGSGDLVERVVLAYLESSAELIAELQSAVESSDADSVRTNAHALKSSSANVGALNLADLCQQIENKAREENLSDTDILQRRIQQEYEQAVAALQLRIEATAA